MNLLYLLFPLGCAVGFISCWRWVAEPLRREVQDSDEKLVKALKAEDEMFQLNKKLAEQNQQLQRGSGLPSVPVPARSEFPTATAVVGLLKAQESPRLSTRDPKAPGANSRDAQPQSAGLAQLQPPSLNPAPPVRTDSAVTASYPRGTACETRLGEGSAVVSNPNAGIKERFEGGRWS